MSVQCFMIFSNKLQIFSSIQARSESVLKEIIDKFFSKIKNLATGFYGKTRDEGASM